MTVSAQLVKQLRDKTGVSMGACKDALKHVDGDVDKAIERLRVLGALRAQDISDRATKQGAVVCYVHPGNQMAAMVRVECETDFVARTSEFMDFCRDVAMHIVASRPMFIQLDEATGTSYFVGERGLIEQEMQADPKMSKKPVEMRDKILVGKLEKRMKEVTLMEQPFVKDPTKTVEQLRIELVQKLGENVRVVDMYRMDVREK